jgi:septal ring factor EnvC (AmiA/AmiB activator)
MVKIDNLTNQPVNNQTNSSANQLNSTPIKKEESGLIKTIGQLLPLAPFVYEQFTGQKVPQMSGTIAEIQMTLISIQNNLQTIANNQQSLNQRLISLESSANNLSNQFNSLRLTHTREKKEIAYNNPPLEESENQEY